MRVELSNDDAEMIAAALRRCDESDALVALADRFVPPERLTAVLLPEGVKLPEVGPPVAECEGCAGEIHSHPAHGWIHSFDTDHPAEPGELVPTCPRCGGQSFGYLEGNEQYWPPSSVEDGVVFVDTIGWDGIGESGDSDPGLFCDEWQGGGCGAPIDLPDGWEVEFS